MKSKIIAILLLIFLLFGCSTITNKVTVDNKKYTYFVSYIAWQDMKSYKFGWEEINKNKPIQDNKDISRISAYIMAKYKYVSVIIINWREFE